MRYQRFARLVTLSCVALAFALAACTSTPTEEGGTGSLEAKLTMTFPPAGADKKVDEICGTIWCTGIDPILGVPRPSQEFPEKWCADVSTTEDEDGFGLLAMRGLSAPGECTLWGQGMTKDGTTTCEDTVTFDVKVNQTTNITVFFNCITDPLYGGVDAAATTNSCPVYRKILVTPTTQSIGSDFTVSTEVYDPEDENANVRVESDCGPVDDSLQTNVPSCDEKDGALCTAAETTVECDDAKACAITVTVEAIDPRELEGCNGELPNGQDNDAAKQTIDVICQQALDCGDGSIVSPETCDPPSVADTNIPPRCLGLCVANKDAQWCDAGCQEIVDPCNPVDRFCPTATEAGLDDDCVKATTCTPPAVPVAGDVPTCGFDFLPIGTSCGDGINDECDGAGTCLTGQACTIGDPSLCSAVQCKVASCPAGLCEYAADSAQNGDTCNSGQGSTAGACNGTTGNCDSTDECTANDVSGCPTPAECFDAVCDTPTGGPWVCDTDFDATNSCKTCTNNPDCVCDATTETCQDAPPDCGDHVCNFTAATGSLILLQTAAFPISAPADGSANVLCSGNSPDASGKCACGGEFVSVDPVLISGVGLVCINGVPSSVCEGRGLVGDVDCDGGADTDQDVLVEVDHTLAACDGKSSCEASCGQACTAAGKIPASATCEGFCQLAGTVCTMDADCTAIAGDTCPGKEPVNHQGQCNCTCLTLGDGAEDDPGDARFFVGFGISVLTDPSPAFCTGTSTPCHSDADCTGGATCAGDCGFDGICCNEDDVPAINIPPQCAPFTTTSAETVVANVNASTNTLGPFSVSGTPFTCDADDVPTSPLAGTNLRTAASFLDSTLGDMAATIELNCQ